MFVYLWVGQAGVVRFEVVDDALHCSGQRGATHQQHQQHDVGEGGGQVHHLKQMQNVSERREGGATQEGQDFNGL